PQGQQAGPDRRLDRPGRPLRLRGRGTRMNAAPADFTAKEPEMEIHLAKTAGFCFGVDRAVQLTCRLLDAGEKVATLGPLIHNPQVVAGLEQRGAKVAASPAGVPPGYKVVIRSHGVPQSVYDELTALGIPWEDATCPFVAKIHAIARRAEREG